MSPADTVEQVEQVEVLPCQDAGTRPAGTWGLELHAGLSLVSIDLQPLPVFPALTMGAAVEYGVSERVDLGLRYTTWLGFDHRLGPEAQLGLLSAGAWDVGLRAHPWLRIAGAAGETLSYGGDLSTQSAAVLTWRGPTGRLAATFELGETLQWVLFERLDGERYADTTPWHATVDLAAEIAWRDRYARALALRLELGVPRAPADPLSVLGTRPRIVFAGHFAHLPRGRERGD